jgi:hypothetical protein
MVMSPRLLRREVGAQVLPQTGWAECAVVYYQLQALVFHSWNRPLVRTYDVCPISHQWQYRNGDVSILSRRTRTQGSNVMQGGRQARPSVSFPNLASQPHPVRRRVAIECRLRLPCSRNRVPLSCSLQCYLFQIRKPPALCPR